MSDASTLLSATIRGDGTRCSAWTERSTTRTSPGCWTELTRRGGWLLVEGLDGAPSELLDAFRVYQTTPG